MPEVTSEGLLLRVASGDSAAVQRCVDEFGGLVWSLARRWSTDAADAEDAVQEVFFDVWKSASRFDPAKASERGFVAMIARRRLIDRARKRDRRPALESLPDGFDFPNDAHLEVDRRFNVERARAVLAQLSPDQRRFLEMALLQDMTHEEIARETDTPLGTVKSHIRRGLKKARDLVAPESTEGEAV